jgi:hypothetical protein
MRSSPHIRSSATAGERPRVREAGRGAVPGPQRLKHAPGLRTHVRVRGDIAGSGPIVNFGMRCLRAGEADDLRRGSFRYRRRGDQGGRKDVRSTEWSACRVLARRRGVGVGRTGSLAGGAAAAEEEPRGGRAHVAGRGRALRLAAEGRRAGGGKGVAGRRPSHHHRRREGRLRGLDPAPGGSAPRRPPSLLGAGC